MNGSQRAVYEEPLCRDIYKIYRVKTKESNNKKEDGWKFWGLVGSTESENQRSYLLT